MYFKKHCKVVFGSYVESHNDTTITNNINPRSYEFISLGPIVNLQRIRMVFFLNTGKVLNRGSIILITVLYQVVI